MKSYTILKKIWKLSNRKRTIVGILTTSLPKSFDLYHPCALGFRLTNIQNNHTVSVMIKREKILPLQHLIYNSIYTFSIHKSAHFFSECSAHFLIIPQVCQFVINPFNQVLLFSGISCVE